MTHWNPNQPPEDGLPPQEVRLIELRAEPWPDNSRRIRVHLEITPFLERPDLEVTITDHKEEEVASIHIIETIDARMTFTMHIRGNEPGSGKYQLNARLFYAEVGDVDQKQTVFETNENIEET